MGQPACQISHSVSPTPLAVASPSEPAVVQADNKGKKRILQPLKCFVICGAYNAIHQGFKRGMTFAKLSSPEAEESKMFFFLS